MKDFIEVISNGETPEEATERALKELNLTRDQVEVDCVKIEVEDDEKEELLNYIQKVNEMMIKRDEAIDEIAHYLFLALTRKFK